MSVLSVQVATFRTALGNISGLTALPEGVTIEDVPDADKTYFSIEEGDADRLGAEHGGGAYVEHFGEIRLRVRWLMDHDQEAFHATKSDHLQSINAAMNKVSNQTAGVMLVELLSSAQSQVETVVSLERVYSVRYRVAEVLT